MPNDDDRIKSLMESVARLEILEKEHDKRLATIEKRLAKMGKK